MTWAQVWPLNEKKCARLSPWRRTPSPSKLSRSLGTEGYFLGTSLYRKSLQASLDWARVTTAAQSHLSEMRRP
jgi:hypothetical protein